jgi:serine/threonine protein phosphatase PrpC
MKCPKCGTVARPPSRFCEFDGTQLVPQTPIEADDLTLMPPPVHTCLCGGIISEAGFCTTCGRARPTISHSYDRVEQAPAPELAGLSDVGRRHPWNEDALSLAAGVHDGQPVYILVVCDGVSSARDSQFMARLAADVTRDQLLKFEGNDPGDGMRQAILSAHRALCESRDPDPDRTVVRGKVQDPGCAIVAARVHAGHATIGWVGDSRAYRLSGQGGAAVTHDHSWFNEVVDAGVMTPEEASQAPERNAIMRCLGPLGGNGPRQEPQVDVVDCALSSGQMLLLCSDGLWKYAAQPSDLARLVQLLPAIAPPLDVSRLMVDYANQCGGSDNITAAILKMP